MSTKQFKAESKRLLEMMINSIYTHKEIFLRELISNASDAIDKSYYRSLTNPEIDFHGEDFFIEIKADKENRTLTLIDTGIGMTKEELESNLGTIAKSGSLAFKQENEAKEGVDIIGQFGVGFYSAFMVADEVTVLSKPAVDQGENEVKAHKWTSKGADGYSIAPADTADMKTGTVITLKIKENTEDENYDEFLEDYRIKSLVKKYSDFIKYPIKMGEETINSMVPIWRKNKSELKEEDYVEFYQEKHFGFDKPLKHIHASVDGVTSYNAILYIPAKAPYDFYTKEFEKGLELYSNGVMIMHKCADLLPDYFSFVQGLVDSADLSLNISRELLQHDRQLQFIAKKIKEKIKNELLSMQKNDREKYVEFFKSFGRTLKYGVYSDWGANKELLQDLLMFHTSAGEEMVTLDEYVARMKEDQKYIYYGTGDSVKKIGKLPQTEMILEKGFEILYLTEEIDEFAIKMLMNYKEKEFKSISSGDLGIEGEPKEEGTSEATTEQDEIFAALKEALGEKVKSVRASKRLKTHPVCLTSEGELSIEMEKVLNMMPDNGGVKAEKVLELNVNHEIYESLKKAFAGDREKLAVYASVLYNQALLIEGLTIEDPVQYANDICQLIK